MPVPSAAGALADGEWAGQPCFIIGGGESLKGFDFERLRGHGRIIAINRAFEFVPFADIVFLMDNSYYQDILKGKFGPEVRSKWQSFWGRKVFLNLSGYQMGADIISIPSLGFFGPQHPIREGLYHGNNSGAGAIGLACCLGADPVYLLGYDCRGAHFHDGYGKETGDRIGRVFADSLGELAKYNVNHRIINLNPQSASAAFPFGDIDKVLPVCASNDSRITVITPTGDRPLAFALCQQWMKNQTLKPGQWIVVDDGKIPLIPTAAMQYVRRELRPDDPQHTLIMNLRAGFPFIRGDKILVMEDDEYYAPGYIGEMANRLDQHEVVGIMKAKYYHLPMGGYLQINNRTHASLAETGFRKSFLPEFETLWAGDTSLDMRIWQKAGNRGALFADDNQPLYLGIKGLPGRAGIGAGHNPSLYRMKDTADRMVLRRWVLKDYQVYLDILGGKLTSENYSLYFPPPVLPITGITVCQNTKNLVERAYTSIRRFHPDLPIIIVDGSDPGDPCAVYVRGLASDKTVVISLGYNIGHGRGMCMGIDKVKTPYALIFDSDIEMLKSPVEAMLGMMEEDTFGIGYIEEKTAFDGFEWGWPGHNTPGEWMPYLHPMFQLVNIKNYRKFHPYVHHGAPCYLTMLDIYKKGLSGKILKQFPGLGHSSGKGLNWTGIPREHIRHDPGSTIKERTGQAPRKIEGGWVMNVGLV